jgi:hypothetical protein
VSDYWKTRALRAETAVMHLLWMTPIPARGRNPGESAGEFSDRIRSEAEIRYPDQVARSTHMRIGVFEGAESCDCDPADPDYDSWHCEEDEAGEVLCSRSVLGFVCEFCESGDGAGGPSWKPESVEWPCPVIIGMDRKMGRDHGQ